MYQMTLEKKIVAVHLLLSLVVYQTPKKGSCGSVIVIFASGSLRWPPLHWTVQILRNPLLFFLVSHFRLHLPMGYIMF